MLLLLALLQDERTLWFAHDDLSIVRLLEADALKPVPRKEWPAHEFRGTVVFQVEETLRGPRRSGDRFTLPRIEFRLRGSDRPTTLWDGLDLQVGRRYLYAPGAEEPAVLAPMERGGRRSLDVEELRLIVRLNGLPPPEQGSALRDLLKRPRWSLALAGATRELLQRHPERAANADALLDALRREELSADDRLFWAATLSRMSQPDQPWSSEGNRRVCEAWWKLLDRGVPPEGEDPRLLLHAVAGLRDFLWAPGAVAPPATDFIPAGCSPERILQALDAAGRRDSTHYMSGSVRLPEHPDLDRMRRYLGIKARR